MGDRLRLAVGMMGNAASMLLYAAPIITMSRVMRKKSTEEFSCVPYILAVFNCLIYTWYGLPVVSNRWENFPLITVNGLGIFLEISFILIYFYYASPYEKKKVAVLMSAVLATMCLTGIVSAFALHDHYHRKVFVGSVGFVASVAMFAGPLVALKRVIETKSVEYMPFSLSFCSFLVSTLWMAYGLLSHDVFLSLPNIIGTPLGALQLVVYCMYRKGGGAAVVEEPTKYDVEQNDVVKMEVSGKHDGDYDESGKNNTIKHIQPLQLVVTKEI